MFEIISRFQFFITSKNFIVVMCCISLNMHFLLESKIFIIEIPEDSMFIFLVKNAAFIPICHFQDDLSQKLHQTVCM